MKTFELFRKTAFLEGISYLSFFITVPLKRIFNMPTPNYIIGMAHGILFIMFFILAARLFFSKKFTFKDFILSMIASLLPFGTFVAEKKLFKPIEQKING